MERLVDLIEAYLRKKGPCTVDELEKAFSDHARSTIRGRLSELKKNGKAKRPTPKTWEYKNDPV